MKFEIYEYTVEAGKVGATYLFTTDGQGLCDRFAEHTITFHPGYPECPWIHISFHAYKRHEDADGWWEERRILGIRIED